MPTPRKTTTTARKAPAKKAAARSGNPATRAAAQQTSTVHTGGVSSVGSFKKKTEATLIALPSGESVMMVRPGLTAMLSENLLGDSLTALAQKAVDNGQGKGVSAKEQEALAQDPKKVAELLAAFDKIVIRCWVEPKVHTTPPEGAERSDDLLYADEIDLDDKMFTFSYASGGSSDLERFRLESQAALAGLPAGQGMASPTV